MSTDSSFEKTVSGDLSLFKSGAQNTGKTMSKVSRRHGYIGQAEEARLSLPVASRYSLLLSRGGGGPGGGMGEQQWVCHL
jgi:hypothetical protein